MWCNGRWVTNPIIPTIFDDSMSYYEVLSKLRQSICDLKNYVDELYNGIEGYIDSEILKAKNELKILINNIESDLNNKIKTLDNKTDQNLSNLLNYVNTQDDLIKNIIYTTDQINRIWTKEEIEKVKKLVNEINEDGFLVYNPWEGIYTKMQQVIWDVYNILLFFFNLTAQEYDDLNLTAKQYDLKYLTAFQYDLYGKYYLSYVFMIYMYSPVTGVYGPITQAIYDLASLHYNNVTCIYYDNKNYSAEVYDNLNISAYDFSYTLNILEG